MTLLKAIKIIAGSKFQCRYKIGINTYTQLRAIAFISMFENAEFEFKATTATVYRKSGSQAVKIDITEIVIINNITL